MNLLKNTTRWSPRPRATIVPVLLAACGMTASLVGCGSFTRSASTAPAIAGDIYLEVDRRSDTQVRVGEPFQYDIKIRNTTNQPLHNVVVREAIDSRNMTLVSSTPSPMHSGDTERADATSQNPRINAPRWTQVSFAQPASRNSSRQSNNDSESSDASGNNDSGSNAWDIGTLEPYEAETVRVTATADSEGQIRSCLTADYDLAVCTTLQAVQPDIALDRVVASGKSRVYACDPMQITYTVTNSGSGVSDPVVVEEDFPAGIRTQNGRSAVRVNFERLDPGETLSKTVALAGSSADTFEGYAVATTDNTRARSKKSRVNILRPRVEVSADGPSRQYFGRSITQSVTVTNTSDDPAKSLQLVPGFDSDATNISASTSRRSSESTEAYLVGDLGPGESRTINFEFDPDEVGTIDNSYRVTGYCVAADTTNATTTIVGVPAIRLEAYDTTDPVSVGDEVRYEVRVKNQGTADGLNVQLVTDVPDGLEFLRAEGDREIRVRNGQLRFEPLQSLKPEDTESWTLLFRANEAGRTRLEVELSSNATRRPIIEQEPTNILAR